MNLLDLIYPKFCFGCSYPGQYICARCRQTKIQIYHQQFCHVCRTPVNNGYAHSECLANSYLDGVLVCTVYTEIIKEIVMGIKYRSCFDSVAEVAGLMNLLSHDTDIFADAVITSVPLSRYKLWKRGFNQAELLARELVKLKKLPYARLLRRAKNTHTQVGKGKMDRQDNLIGAFQATRDAGNVNRVVLVDDVMTTGTTLEQCAKTLKSAGVKQVYGLVLARGAT